MGDLGAVVLVASEVSAEIRLLIGESPDDQQEDEGKQDESPPGPQSHWKPEHHQKAGTLQGVTDQRIGSGRNHGLLWLHRDRCGGIGVDTKHQTIARAGVSPARTLYDHMGQRHR